MSMPSKPSSESAARGEGKQIPIEDAQATTAESKPSSPTAHSDGSSNPSPEATSPVASADPQGSATAGTVSTGQDATDSSAAEAPIEGEVEDAEAAPATSEVVARAQAEAKEWQDKFMRLHAEWDTYRRRTAEQRTTEKALATEKLVTSLLPVIDDFERTVDYAVKNGETGLLDGVKAVHAKFVGVLSKSGVEVVDPAGEAFDALEAQAVATVPDDSVPDETVNEVYQKGYKMGPKVLRPAMVTVTTGGPKREKPQEDAGKK